MGWLVPAAPATKRKALSLPARGSRRSSSSSLWATVETSQSSSSSSSSPQSNTSPPDHVVSTPLATHTFAGQVEQGMKDRFGGEENVERILQSWRLLDAGYEHRAFVGNDLASSSSSSSSDDDDDNKRRDAETSLCHQHCHSYVPGLSIQEFWNTNDFDWCKRLARSYPAIRQEFDRVVMSGDASTLQEQGNNIWAGALTEDAGSYGVGWKTLVLMDRGRWDPINVNLFPVTAQAVRDSHAPVVEVFFASMQAASEIQPHSDFTNFVLTSHLALDIPQSGENVCRLTVGDTTRQWINGNVMLFDTSLLHDAINESPDQTRYILMLRVWHPDLSDTERQALQFTYDCLEEPNLVVPTATAEQRLIAEQTVKSLRVFPEIQKRKAKAAGFGVGGGVGGNRNQNKKKKKRKGKK